MAMANGTNCQSSCGLPTNLMFTGCQTLKSYMPAKYGGYPTSDIPLVLQIA